MLGHGGGGYKRRQRGRQKTKRARRSMLFCGGLGRFSRGVHMIDRYRGVDNKNTDRLKG